MNDFDESSLIKDEISEIKWITPDELKTELENNRDVYCPWMVIALYFLDDCESDTKEKFGSLISEWTKGELKMVYENAIKHYIPENKWRLIK